MNKNVLIADSIKYQPHIYAFDMWMQETFRRMDVSQLLLYFVDVVNPAVLPVLAQEFDVLGIKGWDFAADVDAQRALIKNAINLHRFKGTPWAIEQVILQAGLTGATLQESVGTDPDTGWAVFRIVLDTSVILPDAAQIENAITLINLYKNARSVLEGLTYTGLNFSDGLTLTEDDLTIDADETLNSDTLGMTGVFRYDGMVYYDGSHNWSQDTDTIVIVI